VGTAFTGTGRQHRTAQQGAAGIEAAEGITDHPARAPGAGIGGPLLGLHLQGHAGEGIATVAQAVAVAALQHEKRAPTVLQPAARLGHVCQGLHIQAIEQLIAADLA